MNPQAKRNPSFIVTSERGHFAYEVMPDELEDRKKVLKKCKWPVSKWVIFCETLQAEGFRTFLYEAKRTNSKYVYVTQGKTKKFKVRYSNHKPSSWAEAKKDCDFFVGVTNTGCTNTSDALRAVREFFKTQTQGE